jgi:opacity protein-like surface antigen
MHGSKPIKTLLFSLALLLVISPNQAFSQDSTGSSAKDKKHAIGFGLGQYFLAGQFDNQGQDGIGYALLYNYLSGDVFHLDAGVNFADMDGNNDLRLKSATIGVKANLLYLDNLIPFLKAGLGFYKPSGLIGAERVSKTVFGFHLGLGGDLQVHENVTVGAAFTFHNPFDAEVTNAAGQRLDLNGAFHTLLIRVRYLL